MKIETFTVGRFAVNTFLLTDPTTGHAAIVDTGETDELVDALAQLTPRPDVRAILLTHAHIDHAGALPLLQQAFPSARTYLPELEQPLFATLPHQGTLFGMPGLNRPCGRVDVFVKDGDTIELGATKLRFLSTPGHTPGMGCFYDDHDIFVGDTLFAGSIGRTDFPMSDPLLMKDSLRRLMELPGTLRVHSGHGPDTTLADELAENPFLGYLRTERGMATPGIRWW